MGEGVYTKENLNELNSLNKLNEFLMSEFKKIRLDTEKDRQEFLKFCAGFKSSAYSTRNTIMLVCQAKAMEVLPVFGTYNEWREKCGVAVRRGEAAMTICVPRPIDGYIAKDSKGQDCFIRKAYLNAEQQREYEEKVKSGEAKSHTILNFTFKPSIFSLSQTTMKEQDRVKYLQRYNEYNTEGDNNVLYSKLRAIAQGLNLEVIEQPITDERLGWIDYRDNKLVVKADMPINSKCSVYVHEIGHKLLHGSAHDRSQLSRADREIQAELTSRLLMEKVGLNSSLEFQNRYISDYLLSAAKRQRSDKESSLDHIENEILYKHLNEVMPVVKTLGDILNQDVVGRQSIEKLRSFANQSAADKKPMEME